MQRDPNFNNGFLPNGDDQNRGAKLGIIGSAISTLGDALQTIAGVISLEESRQADIKQQQELDKLQRQIDELKKGKTEGEPITADIKKFNKLLEQILERLDNDE